MATDVMEYIDEREVIEMTRYEVENNKIKIYFDECPDDVIRATLRTCGWHWDYYNKCWTNYNNSENLHWAKLLCEDMNPKKSSVLFELDRYTFSANNVIVRCNSFYCNKYHDVEDVAGLIDVYTRKGHKETCLVPLAYCRTCNTFYILDKTFAALKRKGLITCQVFEETEYRKYLAGENNGLKWKSESILKIWGYNVGAKDALTKEQRHAALENIVDNCPWMTKDRVLSYLDFFIRMHLHQDTAAVDKWRDDRRYIASYKIGSARRVKIKAITVIDTIYC